MEMRKNHGTRMKRKRKIRASHLESMHSIIQTLNNTDFMYFISIKVRFPKILTHVVLSTHNHYLAGIPLRKSFFSHQLISFLAPPHCSNTKVKTNSTSTT